MLIDHPLHICPTKVPCYDISIPQNTLVIHPIRPTSEMLRVIVAGVLLLAACAVDARFMGLTDDDSAAACHNSTSKEMCLERAEEFGCFYCASTILPSGCYVALEAKLLPTCE